MVKSFRLSIVNRYNSQKGVRYVNKRLQDLLKKSSFFKKKFLLYLTKVLFDVPLLICIRIAISINNGGGVPAKITPHLTLAVCRRLLTALQSRNCVAY